MYEKTGLTGTLKTNQRKLCIFCKEKIEDYDANAILATNRSMGFGLIGLSHISCAENNK